jgi:hypothetical protein
MMSPCFVLAWVLLSFPQTEKLSYATFSRMPIERRQQLLDAWSQHPVLRHLQLIADVAAKDPVFTERDLALSSLQRLHDPKRDHAVVSRLHALKPADQKRRAEMINALEGFMTVEGFKAVSEAARSKVKDVKFTALNVLADHPDARYRKMAEDALRKESGTWTAHVRGHLAHSARIYGK